MRSGGREGALESLGGRGGRNRSTLSDINYLFTLCIYVYITGENTTELRIGQIAWCRPMTRITRKIAASDTDTRKESSGRSK